MTIEAIDLVVTCDLLETLDARAGIRLLAADVSTVDALVEAFLADLARVLPAHARLVPYSAAELAAELERMQAQIDLPLVSLDDVSLAWADARYPITPLTNELGVIEWIEKPDSSERWPLPPAGTRVLVGDLGAQSGSSLIRAALDLSSRGMQIAGFLVGVVGKRVAERLRHRHSLHARHQLGTVRWVELRDLLAIDGPWRMTNHVVEREITWSSIVRNGPWNAPTSKNVFGLCDEYRRHLCRVLAPYRAARRLLVPPRGEP